MIVVDRSLPIKYLEADVHIDTIRPYKRADEWFFEVKLSITPDITFVYDKVLLQYVQDIVDELMPDLSANIPRLNWVESGLQESDTYRFIAGVW